MYGRRPAGAKWRGEFEWILTGLQDKRYEFARLPSKPCMCVCKQTGSLVLHRVGDIRFAASRPNLEKLTKQMQHVLWLKVGAIEDIGVSTHSLRMMKIRIEHGFWAIPDEKLVEGVLKLVGLGFISEDVENAREVYQEDRGEHP